MPSQPISLKINRDKIDPKRLFKGEKGTYLDAVLIPTPDSKYGEDYMVVQGVSREERERGIKGPIIGSAKLIGRKASSPVAKEKAESAPESDDKPDLPF